MRVDAQLLVGPALVALYLKDCLLLLGRDEAVLVRGWRGRWRAGFGLLDWRLRRREPYLCHPFKPWEPVLRLRWDAAAGPAPAAAAPASVPPELGLGPWVAIIWLLLFVALPTAFYGQLGLHAILAVLGALYLTIAASLGLAWRRRAALGLSGPDFGVLAFEVLACAPYAANLVRRLSLQRKVDEDLLAACDAPAGHAARWPTCTHSAWPASTTNSIGPTRIPRVRARCAPRGRASRVSLRMNNTDILAIVGCGVLGYGIIHLVLNKPTPPAAPPRPPLQPPPVFAPNWSRVLELPADASVDEIREAYRRLMSQYHPDKVASLGRELRELAEAKSKEIGVAYQEAVQRARRAR